MAAASPSVESSLSVTEDPACSPHHTALPCRSAQSSESWDTESWFPCPNKRGSEHLGTKDYYLLPFIWYLHGDSARCPEPPKLCYKIIFYSKKDNTEEKTIVIKMQDA